MHNLTFKLPCQKIENIISITCSINLKHKVHTYNGFGRWAWHLLHLGVDMTNGNWTIHINSWTNPIFKKTHEALYLMHTNARHRRFYQIFWMWYNPRTNKFEFGPHICGIWYNPMGDEVEYMHSLHNLPPKKNIWPLPKKKNMWPLSRGN
jgi:hypothetical protein